MGIRGGIPLTFKARGLSDNADSTNAFPGAMSVLKDLVPSPRTQQQFVPRPASTQLTNFTGFTTPGFISALFVVGNRAYGMIASGRNAGKDEPFCYDYNLGAFVTIANVTAANCPTSPSTSGDWTPPTMSMIGNRIMITHPGFTGVPNYIGWIDMRSFTSNTQVGDTNSSTTLTNLHPTGPIAAGWQVGDKITGTDIPANTYIVSMTATTVVISNAATGSTPNVTFTVTSGTFAAPTYGAGNTNTNGLAAVPVAVEQFNGRAYYAVNNGVQFSDALNPTQITNATQALTLGDDQPVTALAGLPLSNQVVGGVLQSLIAFKADDLYYQITGDAATSNLASNAVAGSVGTLAPNTVVSTSKGLAYIAPDGLRFIGLDGKCSDPIGANGDGVNVPFVFAVNPSRMCAATNQSVLRVSVQNGDVNGQPVQEYWFDLRLGIWTGPHSFPASLIQGDHGGTNAFILAASGIDAKLWHSTVTPDANSSYTENSVAMTWIWQTSLLPDNDRNEGNQVVESNLGATMPATQAITILALDELSAQLGLVSLSGSGMTGTIWGSFTWGAAPWGSSVTPYRQYTLPWPNPLVFKQAFIRVTGASQSNFAIGNFYCKYQVLGYQGNLA